MNTGKEVAGVDLGALGDPLAPVLYTLAELGIYPTETSLGRWRRGGRSAIELGDKVRCAHILTDNTALKKNQVYHSIAEAGVRSREPWQENLFKTRGFTDDLANECEMTPTTLRTALRAMRAEVLFNGKFTEEQTELFRNIANGFISGYSALPKWFQSTLADGLDSEWDHTIAGFYKLLYAKNSTRAIGIWTPSEIGFMERYYADQLAGNNELTVFDRFILENYRANYAFIFMAEQIRKKTSVKLDLNTLTTHRNFLVYGKSTNPIYGKSASENRKVELG